jgi:hypothetical protein
MKFSIENATNLVKSWYAQLNGNVTNVYKKGDAAKVIVGLTDSLIGYGTEFKTYIVDREVGVLEIPTTMTINNNNELLSTSYVTSLKEII